MNRRSIFKGVALTALLLSISGWSQVKESSTELTAQNAKPGTMQPSIGVNTIHGDMAGKAPAFLSENGCGFSLSGDLLYRKAKLDNLDFAVRVTQDYPSLPTTSTTITMNEQIYQPNFHWGWGFRVDAGYTFFPQDDWETDFVWTYLYNKASEHTTSPESVFSEQAPSVVLIPTWAQVLSGISFFIEDASSHWKLHFNTFDLELARNYFVSKFFSMRPLISLRGAWIKQDFSISYQAIPLEGVSIPTVGEMENNYWGIGPRLGTDLFWQVVSHWGFYGNISASLLYGRFLVKQDFNIAAPNEDLVFNYKKNLWRARPNVDLGLGTEVEFFMGQNDAYHLTMGIGYEVSYWFMQNMLQRTELTTGDFQEENGDLAMQGWNFHVRFDF